MSKHFVVGVYGYKNCSLLSMEGATMAECRRMIAWQGPCGTPYHICRPTEERGVFASVETGNLFPVNRGPFTEKAFEAALNKIWPTTGGPCLAKD
ncbi:hypothetical protein [Brucella sp. 10RB9210]|uniref:hypothetical protein n=1 Tax=Brucella sp. 10RB9210 TaxID=1844037 RepID=UPI0012AD8570|nr:hypothetical protein [Brucella sp. 10RB9210]MRN79442.1 hypothetical protein [Brucella sp. 10RB9210]